MKKSYIIIGAVIGVFLIWGVFTYNKLITLDENISGQWGNVESSYQRRADLIPNIVNTAKGYAEFEQETLTKVIEARSKATSITIDPTNITPAQMEQFQQAQGGLSSALSKLLVTFERYPDLKANENFKELINELERTENRINVERNRFNEALKPYNQKVRKFPSMFIASAAGFETKEYFESNNGAENAYIVEF